MNAFGKKYHIWMLAQSVSQSMFYEVLKNGVSDDVFKRKCLLNGEIMFHSAFIKEFWRIFIRSERLDTNYCQSQGWKNFVCISITKHWEAWNISFENNCAHLKMKDSFHSATQFGSWFLKKKFIWCTFLHRSASMHQKCQRGTHNIFSALKSQ